MSISEKSFLNRLYDRGEEKQKFSIQELEFKLTFMIKNSHGSWQWYLKSS